MGEEQALLDRILENTSEGVFLLDAVRDGEGRIADFEWRVVNPAAAALTGYAAAEMLGKRLRETAPGDETERLFKSYVRAIETGTSVEHEYPCPREGYAEQVLRARVVAHGDGVLVTFSDVTRSRRLETEYEQFFETSPDLLCVSDESGYFLRVNGSWEQTLGWSRAEIMAAPFIDFVHPDDVAATLEKASGLLEGQPVIRFENRYRRKGGGYCPIEWHAHPLPNGTFHAVGRDISEQKSIVRALQDNEARAREAEDVLRDAIDAISEGFALYDTEDRLVISNRRQSEIFTPFPKPPNAVGMTHEELLRRNVAQGIYADPKAQENPEAFITSRLHHHQQLNDVPALLHLTSGRWAQIRKRRTSQGGVVTVTSDVTDLKRAEQQLSDAIDSIHEGLALWDQNDRLALCNDSFRGFWSPDIREKVLPGITFEDLLRMSIASGTTVVDRDAEDYIARRLERHRGGGRPFEIAQSDGRWLMVNERATTDGGVVGLYTDVTEIKRQERMLRQQARTDPLTAVYNRRHFIELAERELQRAVRFSHPVSVMMIDIDHFKQINDTHGHAAGDRVLQRLAGCCRDALREIDVFGRLGGEEFSVLLPETTRDGAVVVAERLREAVAALQVSAPAAPPLSFTISIGVAEWSREDPAVETVLARADAALYEAKGAGRNRTKAA